MFDKYELLEACRPKHHAVRREALRFLLEYSSLIRILTDKSCKT